MSEVAGMTHVLYIHCKLCVSRLYGITETTLALCQ